MFPVLPNEFFVFLVFWIAATTHVYGVPFLLPDIQPPRNTGNIRNSVEKPEVGPDFSWNTTGNTENTPADGRSPAPTELDLFEPGMVAG